VECRSICAVISKSAITPCLSGRIARIEAGVRPIMRLASAAAAWTWPVRSSTATTEGSKTTMPSPRTKTSELAVPRSTASSRPANERRNATKTPGEPSARPPRTRPLKRGQASRFYATLTLHVDYRDDAGDDRRGAAAGHDRGVARARLGGADARACGRGGRPCAVYALAPGPDA